MREVFGLVVVACVLHGFVIQTTINQPPIVSIHAPQNGATFFAPANFTVEVDARDLDGSIASVTLMSENASLGPVTTAPYVFNLINKPPGLYTFMAQATDNRQTVTYSTPITVAGHDADRYAALRGDRDRLAVPCGRAGGEPLRGRWRDGAVSRCRWSRLRSRDERGESGERRLPDGAVGDRACRADMFTAHWTKGGETGLVYSYVVKGC